MNPNLRRVRLCFHSRGATKGKREKRERRSENQAVLLSKRSEEKKRQAGKTRSSLTQIAGTPAAVGYKSHGKAKAEVGLARGNGGKGEKKEKKEPA
jgi:hypothetical protein